MLNKQYNHLFRKGNKMSEIATKLSSLVFFALYAGVLIYLVRLVVRLVRAVEKIARIFESSHRESEQK